MLGVAGSLLVQGGAPALTVSAVARSLSAPSGSVYYRFESRDHLVAALWLRTVERFDRDVVAGLATEGNLVTIGAAVARQVVEWCAANPTDAHVLTRLSMADLVDGKVPADLARRARQVARRQRRAVERFADRLRLDVEVVRFAVVTIPYAAVRRAIAEGAEIPPWTSDAVERAAAAVLSEHTET